MSEKGFGTGSEDSEAGDALPDEQESAHAGELDHVHEKGTEARRRSVEAQAISSRISGRKSQSQSAEFLKELRLITEWGAVLSVRGREVVQLQAGQIGGICKLIGQLHSEMGMINKNLRDSMKEVAGATDAAAEHREAMEETLQKRGERFDSYEDSLVALRREMQEQLRSSNDEWRESTQAMLDKSKRASQGAVDRLRQDVDTHIESSGAVDQNHQMAIDRFSQKLEDLDGRLVGNFNRLRDEHHRVDNLADHALRAAGALDDVNRRLEWAEKAEEDVKAVARTVGGLHINELRVLAQPGSGAAGIEDGSEDDEVQPLSRQVSPESALSFFGAPPSLDECGSTSAVSAGDGGAASSAERIWQRKSVKSIGSTGDDAALMSGGALGRLERRLAQIEVGEKEMLQAHEILERRVSAFQSLKVKGTLENMKKEFVQLRDSSKEFQSVVTTQLSEFKKQELSHAIQDFRSRCTGIIKMLSPLELFHAWRQFVKINIRHRQALGRVKAMYSKRHVGIRVESWNYISQKCLVRTAVSRIESREENVESQLETLSATVRKRERAAVEQAKDVHSRISTIEKRLEYHGSKKADHASMMDMFAALEDRIDREVDPDGLRRNIADVWEAMKELESNKTDVKMTERNGKRVNELTMEVRQALKEHDTIIRKCCTYDDLSVKANAGVVEQVVIMLAQQADQLARLVASDLDMFKLTLGRFLELSPDVRKAALSLGLQQNEQCITCRKVERRLVDHPMTGTNGMLYRQSPESLEAMGEETQRVVNEKIKFPSHLMSSLVAGTATSPSGDPWAPVRPGPQQEVAGKVSTKIFNSEVVGKIENQTLLARIRQLVSREPGWLAGSDVRALAGADVERCKRPADQLPECPSSRSATPAASVVSGDVSSARSRPTSSGGRSYFPASARAELQGERAPFFKDLPKGSLKSRAAPPRQMNAASPEPGNGQIAPEFRVLSPLHSQE